MDINRKINHEQKRIRATVIRAYMEETGIEECVCYTCGNASKYLEAEGLEVNEIIEPKEWKNVADIYSDWGKFGVFNATSGMLPSEMMGHIAQALEVLYREELKGVDHLYIASGSGETFVCMKMAFPHISMSAVYGIDKATAYNKEASLNRLVDVMAQSVVFETQDV